MLSLIKIISAIFLLSLVLSVQADEKINTQIKPDPVVKLTVKEQAWLAKHKTIRIAYDGSLPPYSFINDSGQFEGIAIEIIDILSQRLGIKFSVYPNSSWNNLYKAASNRKVDVVATMVDRPERRLWFNFTEPYLTKSLVIMTRQDNDSIKTRNDLKKKTVALVKGYQYGDIVKRDFPSIKPYYVNTMLNGLKAVANGKADAAVTFMATNNYLQTIYVMENLKFAAFYDRNSANESIAVRKDWPILVSILQKGLNSLSEEEIQRIFAKWVFPIEPEEKHVSSDTYPDNVPSMPTDNSLINQYFGKAVVPSLIIISALLAWLFHSHIQNRKIIQSNKQVLITNSNLQALQRDLEHLVLKRTAELNSSEQKFRSLVENLRNEYFFYHHDVTGAFTYVSPSVTNILGYEPEEFIAHYRDYLTDNSVNEKIGEYRELSSQGVPNPPYQLEIYDKRKIIHWLEIADSPVYDEYGNCIGVDGIVRDITVRKLADERLIRLSYYDELTGLANRRLFADRLQQTLNLAFRNKTSVALFYLDLDGFKSINDTMGHAAGDEILREASRRLISTLRDSDVAARLGGDEFALLLPGADVDAAEQVAKKILKMFRKPYLIGETTAALGASIGISIYPKNGREGETLISHADAAMYHAKKRNLGFSFYSENMEQAMDQFL
ncbi:MAG: diguanylate cyclase [Methylococcaceae bacterium]|nr:diguanylate cyclase [Methylococcaceae bacterium]